MEADKFLEAMHKKAARIQDDIAREDVRRHDQPRENGCDVNERSQ